MPLLSLDDALRNGIRRDRKSPVGSKEMSLFTGLRPMEFGAKPLEIISTPSWTGYSGTTDHPFPQLFRGRGVTLLADKNEIYEVTESGGSWVATLLDVYDGDNGYFDYGWRIEIAVPSSNYPWHFVDMYNSWMLIRPDITIFKTGQVGGHVFATSDVTIRTGCDFRDSRVLLGGFEASDIYANADWNAYWATFYGNAPDHVKGVIDALGTMGPGNNWVQYGSIGGGDLLWFMSTYLMQYGLMNQDQLQNGILGSSTGWTHTGWTYTTQKMTHNTGNALSLKQEVANQDYALQTNTNYRIRFTVAGVTAGTVTPQIAGALGEAVSADGDVDVELTTAIGTLDFELVPTTDFDGAISKISVTAVPDNEFGTNYFFDLMQRNEFGFTPMPYQGDVACLKPLGDAVIAYGTESGSGKNGGIVALRAHDKYFGQHPPMNIGSGVGVMERGAVGGDETHHLFIDETGELWMMGQDLSCTRLGYQEIFENWIGEQPTISYDPQYDEFWLTSGATPETFVLNRHGLCKAGQNPTSLFIAQGALVGILDGATDDAIELISQPFDAVSVGGTRRDIIVLHSVMVGTTDIDTTGWSVYLDYRMNIGENWTRSDAVTPDARGVARFNMSAVEARIIVSHPDVTDTNGIESLQVDIEINGRAGSRHWYNAPAPGPATV